MNTGETRTDTVEGQKDRQIEAINSLTVALKLSNMSRPSQTELKTAPAPAQLNNGDPAPLTLWGEEM